MTKPDVDSLPARVLIVDDDEPSRQLLATILAPEGYAVQYASSGEEALESVRFQPPDLIMLDAMMPGMDGFQVATRLKRNIVTKSIPIIMVTALDDRSAKALGVGVGVEDYLTKPVDRADVCARVRTMLRLKAYSDYFEMHSLNFANRAGSQPSDLLASAALDQVAFDAAPVGIALTDLDGNLLRVNQRLCDVLGYGRQEAMALAPGALLQSEQSTAETDSIGQLRAGTLNRHLVAEKKYRARDGSQVSARLTMSVNRDKNGTACHFISAIEELPDQRLNSTQARHKPNVRPETALSVAGKT
jgi:PAS domain S-box-containing protein